MHEIDSHEAVFLLEQLKVLAIVNGKQRERFIEDVM